MPFLLRSVSSEIAEVESIIQLIRTLGWTYVGVLYSTARAAAAPHWAHARARAPPQARARARAPA